MKLPEEPTKKVRNVIAAALEYPGYKINDSDLYEIKKLCDALDTTIATMRLHAGDCCSLNNEVELFRGHWEDAEKEITKLRKALKTIINEKGDYWYDKMIRVAKKALEG